MSRLAPLATLRQQFAAARRDRQRHRDIAAALGVSEAELIAAHAGGFDAAESPLRACPVDGPWAELIGALEPLGEVMALTRNASCVHEKVGVYRDASGGKAMGLVLGGAIDLRLFYSQWTSGFAVEEALADGSTQRSLQFYDAHGAAIHKLFLRDASDVAAFRALVQRFAAPPLVAGIEVSPAAPTATETPDAQIDVDALRTAWSSLRDTHEFFGLLKTFGVSRTQALRLAAPAFVERVDNASTHQLLSAAAQQGVPIMVFVGNPGMIQIHSGPVHRIAVMGPWINILDPGFNLHLREDHIASSWLVRKPTVDGLVSSLEIFDAAGRTIAMFFGERKPGRSERCDWRELLAGVAHEAEPCVA